MTYPEWRASDAAFLLLKRCDVWLPRQCLAAHIPDKVTASVAAAAAVAANDYGTTGNCLYHCSFCEGVSFNVKLIIGSRYPVCINPLPAPIFAAVCARDGGNSGKHQCSLYCLLAAISVKRAVVTSSPFVTMWAVLMVSWNICCQWRLG
jgi:hypothetical protein